MLETQSLSFEQKEHQEINLDVFLKSLEKSQVKIKQIHETEFQDRKQEEKELQAYENFFDWKLNIWELNHYLEKWNSNTQETKEKEKLMTYSKLADLSYIHLKTNNDKNPKDNFEFLSVSLDPASFENLNKLFDNPNLATLTKEELFLYDYINQNKDKQFTDRVVLNNETKEILKMAWFGEQILAVNDDKYRDTISDIEPRDYYDWREAEKRFLLEHWLHHLIIKKEKEAKQNFENLKQDFKVLDYFPNEIKNEKSKSWFWAILLEKDGHKYLAIRWTEWLSDWKDLYADAQMLFWKIPEEQAKEMTDFIKRTIKAWEKFSIVWHSLWWALSQIATSMYADQIEETYTFNSPWAKELKISQDSLSKFAKFKDFVHNKDRKETWDLITNVSWRKWLNIISDLWVDIWSYKIELKWLSSHSISELIEYIETLDITNNELEKINIKDPKSDIKQKY